jgi:hypothetical protein
MLVSERLETFITLASLRADRGTIGISSGTIIKILRCNKLALTFGLLCSGILTAYRQPGASITKIAFAFAHKHCFRTKMTKVERSPQHAASVRFEDMKAQSVFRLNETLEQQLSAQSALAHGVKCQVSRDMARYGM